ncbi:MAG: glutamine-hydrolyzing GMP synthase [Bdellovibrionaceae bacterium]|nr:glutamine-hydrolyzing GMP synthase [Pseudobdellovibrionaceae bacterium]
MKKILVLDFGSQYSALIVKAYRKLNIYAELIRYDTPLKDIASQNVKGIVLSGGPLSVSKKDSLYCDVKALQKIAPVFGICYGMQMIAHQWGAELSFETHREYGINTIEWAEPLVSTIPKKHKVWMSHGDSIIKLPSQLKVLAYSNKGTEKEIPVVISANNLLAVQYHPEVLNTEYGNDLLKYFAEDICNIDHVWTPDSREQEVLHAIKNTVGKNEKVLCALSGGVDSSVLGYALSKSLSKEQVYYFFVDTGMLRKNEFTEVLEIYKKMGLNVHGVNYSNLFIKKLKGVSDPERKRKIIGQTFISVFEKEASHFKNIQYLAQGTLYSDVIESSTISSVSEVIKSHHNVGGLPENFNFKLLEPFNKIFKDEVRQLGENLKIDKSILYRHPFPGPGLAIRIIGEVTLKKIEILQNCDEIFIKSLKETGLYSKIWQAFCVLLPIQSVGVQGDSRTYKFVLALRAVTSEDGMTARSYHFDPEVLESISTKITNEVPEVSRIVYDISNKPPSTIEWE